MVVIRTVACRSKLTEFGQPGFPLFPVEPASPWRPVCGKPQNTNQKNGEKLSFRGPHRNLVMDKSPRPLYLVRLIKVERLFPAGQSLPSARAREWRRGGHIGLSSASKRGTAHAQRPLPRGRCLSKVHTTTRLHGRKQDHLSRARSSARSEVAVRTMGNTNQDRLIPWYRR